jgi:ketosteroid isomerase-like protein
MSKQVKLPRVIETFIKATNEHDGETFISSFTEDALVNDVARNFWGREQIKNWADKEIIQPKITFEVDEVIEHYDDYFITALIDGNYDKSKVPDPLYLDYFFTINGDKIVKMIVIKNKKKSASL